MTTKRVSWLWFSLTLLAFLGNGFAQVLAADPEFEVQLIWGTNGEKPKGQQLSDVDSKLKDKLASVFKWKNYFEVTKKEVVAKKNRPPKIKLSDKCDIEVRDAGNSTIEVKLYGEGKYERKVTKAFAPGELIVLAGDAKNNTAWFVVLTPK
ncbi:MAG: hypothetical protein AB1813_29530 [Verrucomicrobiota bacterium]